MGHFLVKLKMSKSPGCPFCGILNYLFLCFVVTSVSSEIRHYVQCTLCAARGPEALTPQGAVSAWSKRFNPIFKATIEGYTEQEDASPHKTQENKTNA